MFGFISRIPLISVLLACSGCMSTSVYMVPEGVKSATIKFETKLKEESITIIGFPNESCNQEDGRLLTILNASDGFPVERKVPAESLYVLSLTSLYPHDISLGDWVSSSDAYTNRAYEKHGESIANVIIGFETEADHEYVVKFRFSKDRFISDVYDHGNLVASSDSLNAVNCEHHLVEAMRRRQR